jgi:hypothetical protein
MSEIIKGMFVNEGNVDFVLHKLKFDVAEFSQMLITYKDVFEANNGKGEINILKSKKINPKTNKPYVYASLSTWKPTQSENKVGVSQHLASREADNDLPF